MEIENKETVTETTSQQNTPAGEIVQQSVTTSVEVDKGEFVVAKVNQVIWFVLALIMILIGVRLLFLLLGANNTGLVSFIYSASNFFIYPFVGIFKSPSYGSSFFDMASVLGIIFYLVLGFIITSLVSLFSKKTE